MWIVKLVKLPTNSGYAPDDFLFTRPGYFPRQVISAMEALELRKQVEDCGGKVTITKEVK